MKTIAITQRLLCHDVYHEIRETLDVRWGNLLETSGYHMLALSYAYEPEIYFEQYKIDGVILSGGNDLSSLAKNELSMMRDRYEKQLLETAMQHEIPILGVCRGAQLIAEFFGGEIMAVPNHAGIIHPICKTLACKMSMPESVVSYHNYGIGSIEIGTILATSQEGFIEAFAIEQKRILCLMWHPERENSDILQRFFK